MFFVLHTGGGGGGICSILSYLLLSYIELFSTAIFWQELVGFGLKNKPSQIYLLRLIYFDWTIFAR